MILKLIDFVLNTVKCILDTSEYVLGTDPKANTIFFLIELLYSNIKVHMTRKFLLSYLMH